MKEQDLLSVLICGVEKSDSFQKIMADGCVSDDEIAELAERVNVLMRRAEAELSEKDFALVAELLTELSVFFAVAKDKMKVD